MSMISSSDNKENNKILISFIGETEIENTDDYDINEMSNSILMSNQNYKTINKEEKIIE